jgi:hypothetical protein
MVESKEFNNAKQKVLLEILTMELDLGFAFASLGTKQWEKSGRERSRQNALESVTQIRNWEGTISDVKDWWQIHSRADELEQLIFAFRA